MKGILILLAGGFLLVPLYAYSASGDQLATENEDKISILQDQASLLEKLFSTQMKVSGYADVEYIASSKEGEEDGFRLHHLSLFFTKKINEQWRFFSEIEFEDAPVIDFKDPSSCTDCSGRLFVEAVNIDYIWKPETAVRFGRFFTPAGIWSLDHYPPFIPTQERPLHIRKMFPQLVDGLALFGSIPFSGSFLSYDLYYGNGEGNPGRRDLNSKKATGLNLNLNFPVLKYTEIGMTYYNDTLNNGTEKSISGVHTKLGIGDFTLQAEYASGDFTPATSAAFDSTGYYTQISYNYVKWLFGYRYDYYDEGTTLPETANADIRNIVFVNYRVDKDIVLKVEHVKESKDKTTPDDNDTNFTIASVVIYLGD